MIEVTHNGETETLDGFNGMEVNGCILLPGGVCEVCLDEDLAEFWTVYGHWRTGGVRALWDCPTKQEAHDLARKCEEELRQENILEFLFDWRKK